MPGMKACTFDNLAAAGHGKLVLSVADPLLELPPVRGRVAGVDAGELGTRLIELAPGTSLVDLARRDGRVDEGNRTVIEHLEEAGAGRELAHLAVAQVDARRPGVELRDERGLPPGWIALMRNSIAQLGARFNTDRMLMEYVDELYLPAHRDLVEALAAA